MSASFNTWLFAWAQPRDSGILAASPSYGVARSSSAGQKKEIDILRLSKNADLDSAGITKQRIVTSNLNITLRLHFKFRFCKKDLKHGLEATCNARLKRIYEFTHGR